MKNIPYESNIVQKNILLFSYLTFRNSLFRTYYRLKSVLME